MKFFAFILSIIQLAALSAETESFHCKANQFLKTPFNLEKVEGDLWHFSLREGSSNCDLNLMRNHTGEVELYPQVETAECSLRNWSRPNTDRALIYFKLDDDFTGGYIKVSLDNSMADFGTSTLTSFIYCSSINR